jgi:hypothetical protein
VAVNFAVVAVAATVTEAGLVSGALLSESFTAVPPVGAAFVKATVQVLEAPELSVVGVQTNEESVVGAAKVKAEGFDTPLRVAVTMAD